MQLYWPCLLDDSGVDTQWLGWLLSLMIFLAGYTEVRRKHREGGSVLKLWINHTHSMLRSQPSLIWRLENTVDIAPSLASGWFLVMLGLIPELRHASKCSVPMPVSLSQKHVTPPLSTSCNSSEVKSLIPKYFSAEPICCYLHSISVVQLITIAMKPTLLKYTVVWTYQGFFFIFTLFYIVEY